MNRVEFLMQGLELNEVQASLISELISDVPNNKLKDFLVFRMNFVQPMKSKELITKEALFEYRKMQIEHRLRAGEKVFSSREEVKKYIETYYRGKDIGNGVGGYHEFVVIALDNDCNIINKYYRPNGRAYVMTSEEMAKVYEDLFQRQHKIGDVKYFTEEEIKERKLLIEQKSKEAETKEIDYKDNSIAPEIQEMMKNRLKKVKI